jgi:tetratricopeptide (TPR) repeat protein
MNSQAWDTLSELGTHHEQLLHFNPGFITKMYQEMLNFYNRYMQVLENFNKHSDEAKALMHQTSELYTKAVEEYSADNSTGAIETLDKVIEMAHRLTNEYGQTFEQAHLAKAQILENMERYDEAVKTLSDALQYITVWNHDLHPLTEKFAIKLGAILMDLDRIEEALSFITTAQRVNELMEDYPNQETMDIYTYLIRIYVKSNKFAEAIKIIDKTILLSEKINGEDNELIGQLKKLKADLSE